MDRLKGIIPPMVTPLTASRALDKVGVRNMVKHLVAGGVDGVFLLGTTGEGPHLPYGLRAELVRLTCAEVKRACGGRGGAIPVLVGITETNLDAALTFAKHCKSFGASAVVAAPPYYFKLTQSECVAWYRTLADGSPLPVVVYDMPAHTDTIVAPDTLAKIVAHKNVIALKDSSANIALFNKFRATLMDTENFSLFMGPDEAMGEAVMMGAQGGVCTGANLWPKTFKKMYEAAVVGDVAEVRRLQQITTTSSYLLYGLGDGQIGFLKGVKAALAEMGLIQNVLAAPFAPFKGAELKPVRAALSKLRKMGAE